MAWLFGYCFGRLLNRSHQTHARELPWFSISRLLWKLGAKNILVQEHGVKPDCWCVCILHSTWQKPQTPMHLTMGSCRSGDSIRCPKIHPQIIFTPKRSRPNPRVTPANRPAISCPTITNRCLVNNHQTLSTTTHVWFTLTQRHSWLLIHHVLHHQRSTCRGSNRFEEDPLTVAVERGCLTRCAHAGRFVCVCWVVLLHGCDGVTIVVNQVWINYISTESRYFIWFDIHICHRWVQETVARSTCYLLRCMPFATGSWISVHHPIASYSNKLSRSWI